ncbi:hypothetical protein CRI93_10080 [Longimonas halophila]|uniref:DUF192 domain-containing protein n=1 Tax=Longimonas halophila TaxID=1469170 RepID=A0A2H3P6J2_9BACT|nr:DUF192 domain-containing protein [Longimonas halophila]PEN06615.1 hypothetical protein CRI93_10080 [Longimonas halophila]
MPYALQRISSLSLVGAVLLLVSIGAGGCDDAAPDRGSPSNPPSFRHDGTLTFLSAEGDSLTTIDIEIADTNAARAQGLMYRRSMRYDRGMLFVFDEPGTGGMWMRNTPLPLDMIFVDADEEVINIVERTTPFSEESVAPEAPRKYVIEVRAGFVERHNLDDTARITWRRLDSSDEEA